MIRCANCGCWRHLHRPECKRCGACDGYVETPDE